MNVYPVFLLVILSVFQVESKIFEVTGSNIQKLQNDGKFMIIFVTKSGCEECRLVYPKFLAASQSYDYDEIRFGKIEHTGLAAKYDVDTFPSILYFKANSKKIQKVPMDITVETIHKLISDATKKDIIDVDLHYTVELEQANFDKILDTPGQFKMLLLYTEDKENKQKVKWLDDFAKIYKNEDKVIFCRLNVNLEGNLRGRFKAKKFPALYWYSDDEIPEKLMYGGRWDRVEMMEFIRDKTGIQRLKDGGLAENAGTLKDFEELFRTHLNTIASGKHMQQVIRKATTLVENYVDKEMAEYYLYLLEEIEYHEETSIIDDERYNIFFALNSDPGPKEKELLIKKQNVIRQIIDLMGNKLLKRNSKDSPIVMKKEPRPHKHSFKKIIRHEEL